MRPRGICPDARLARSGSARTSRISVDTAHWFVAGMICEFFLDPGAYTREDPDWTKDFPFTPKNPLIADVPESFYTRLDNAATAAEYDAITEEQIDYL